MYYSKKNKGAGGGAEGVTDIKNLSRYRRKIWKWQKNLNNMLPDKKQCMTCNNITTIDSKKNDQNLYCYIKDKVLKRPWKKKCKLWIKRETFHIRIHPTKGITLEKIMKDLKKQFPKIEIKIEKKTRTIINANNLEVLRE